MKVISLRIPLHRITPQSGSIASPLQLLIQHTPREKNLPQLPSTLGAQEMYQTHQELMKRQGNKPEKSYIELTPGTPVWVQHRQNATWEPVTVINQCAPNSYWIMQENGTEQPKVYRCTMYDNAENWIYSHRCQADRTYEGLVNRNKKISI